MPPQYPKKGFASYLIPFLLIVILVGTGAAIFHEKVDINDLTRLFKGPEVAKDEKVTIAFQEGNIEHKSWSQEDWQDVQEAKFLQVGDSVRVGSGSTLVLRFFEDSELRLSAGSHLKFIRLDKDDITGNHLAVELIAGQLWGRIQAANAADGDFIINTNNQLLQMSDATVLNVSTNPEITRLLGGNITVNVAEKTNGTRRPVARLSLAGGQQITLDQLTIDQLKAQDTDIQTAIDEAFTASEWYLWNLDKEQKLGELIEFAEAQVEALEPLSEGLVTLSSHTDGQSTGGQLLVQGTYDTSAIQEVFVNGLPATLGIEDEWEAAVTLTSSASVLVVTAIEKESPTEKEALRITLDVDDQGPAIGKVTQPVIDENGNGILEGDQLELLGEVSSDATRVCVSHNDSSPSYCLKQFSSGDESYRYVGAVSYGNVISGKNKYTIFAYDKLENVSSKTIYLFKDEEKPSDKVVEENPVTSSNSEVDLSIPVITAPDPAETFETTESAITVSGSVDTRSQSVLINGKKANYSPGSGVFSISLELELGEQLIKVQSVDAQGNKSKTAPLTVIYLEPLPEDETDEESQ